MQNEKMTKEEVLAKVEWEGGVSETIMGYGLSHKVLPEDTPGSVIDAWYMLEEARVYEESITEWLYAE